MIPTPYGAPLIANVHNTEFTDTNNILAAIQQWRKCIAVLRKQKQNYINFWSWKYMLALSSSRVWLTVVQHIVLSMQMFQRNANYHCCTAPV